MGACATNIQREPLANITRCPSITEYEPTHHETPLKFACSSSSDDSDGHDQKPQFSFKARDRTLLRQTFNDECSSIAACRSLQRILLLFRYHRFLRNSAEMVDQDCHGALLEFLVTKYSHMLNDFHHIVHRHLQTNTDQQRVYQHIHKYMKCNDVSCVHRMRNSNIFYPTKQWPNAELRFYVSVMDAVHCCLWHGFEDHDRDTGPKTQSGSNQCLPPINKLCHDAPMEHIKESMLVDSHSSSNSQLNRFAINKFHTNFAVRGVLRSKLERVKEHEKDNANHRNGELTSMRSTIQYYDYYSDPTLYYWENFRYCACDFADCYVHRKYRNLKEEMLNNAEYRMHSEQFDELWYKAEMLLRHSTFIQRMRYKENVDTVYYGIPRDSALSVANIFCVLVYTHCSVLSACFRDTFRCRDRGESMEQVKRRNAEFWFLSRILRETVDGFGTELGEHRVDTLYTSISCRLFSSFQCRFVGITSMTPNLSVIAAYAMHNIACTNNGIVLELDALHTSDQTLRYLDCGLFSMFANEAEKIFFGGHSALKISSIKMVNACEDYRHFVNTIEIFTHFFNGKHSASSSASSTAQLLSAYDYQIIRELCAYQLQNSDTVCNWIPCYINRLFVAFCESKLDLCIDLYTLRRDCIELLPLFLHTRCDNLLHFDELCCVFSKCRCITVDEVGTVDRAFFEHLLSMIVRMNHKCNACHLRRIELRNVVFKKHDNIQLEWLQYMFVKKKWNAYIDKYSVISNMSQSNQEQMTDLILVKQKYNTQTTNFSLLGYENITM